MIVNLGEMGSSEPERDSKALYFIGPLVHAENQYSLSYFIITEHRVRSDVIHVKYVTTRYTIHVQLCDLITKSSQRPITAGTMACSLYS